MCIAVSDWLFSLFNEMPLIVIGNCFSQFTPNNGVKLVLFESESGVVSWFVCFCIRY